jgi:hypothetical protein
MHGRMNGASVSGSITFPGPPIATDVDIRQNAGQIPVLALYRGRAGVDPDHRGPEQDTSAGRDDHGGSWRAWRSSGYSRRNQVTEANAPNQEPVAANRT